MKEFRLLPLVVFAGLCLLLLKGAAFFFTEAQVLTGSRSLNAQEKVQESGDNVAAKKDVESDKKEGGEKTAEQVEQPPEQNQVAGPLPDSGKPKKEMKPGIVTDLQVAASKSEIELLESLAARRQQLNQREEQLKLKENLLRAAEKRIDERIKQLKEIESKIQADLKNRDVLKSNQYKRLVKIYSSMKPKEAARIFDGLSMPVLIDLVKSMKAAAGSQILAKMDPGKARQLTLKLAEREVAIKPKTKPKNDGLPEIEGERAAKDNQ